VWSNKPNSNDEISLFDLAAVRRRGQPGTQRAKKKRKAGDRRERIRTRPRR
jgi:hypothetical protein